MKREIHFTRVAISGYFDPIHEGHLDHILGAKKLGDVLIAIVGTEEQCDKKHGSHFHSTKGRVCLLFKLGVDRVVLNIDKDGTCAETLRKVKPDIYVMGAEYTIDNLPQKEIDVCREIGCKIVFGVGKRLNRSSSYWEKRCVE